MTASRRARDGFLWGLVASAFVACAPSERVWETELHFADATTTARIGDEIRPVLRSYASARLQPYGPVAIPADRRLTVRVPRPPSIADAVSVLIEARVRRGQRWLRVPPTRGSIEPDGTLRFAVQVPVGVGPRTTVDAVAFSAAPQGRTLDQSPTFTVPERASLEFGFGVLDAAQGEGDVLFGIEACVGGDCLLAFEELVPSGSSGWVDRRISLRPYRGQDVQLRFRARIVPGQDDDRSLPVFADPRIAVARPREQVRNVVLLSLDTLRADQLSSYGYPRETAPFLRDKLENEGTVFSNLIAAAPLTVPAHMTLFTSRAPWSHGLRTNFAPRPLAGSIPTWAELLRDAGYRTSAVTEAGALNANAGFARGFSRYIENKTPQRAGDVAQTLAIARELLADSLGSPFFVFVHTYQAHYPYHPPASYIATLPDPDPVPGLPKHRQPAHYDREIRYVDDTLRAWFAALEESNFLADTWVIVTADHGEEFLEHGQAGHGANLHREVLRVPLFVWGPGIPAGQRIDEPIAQADLLPTILELLGLTAPEGLEGRSFAGRLLGGPPLADAPIYSEAWLGTAEAANLVKIDVPQPSFSVQMGDRKLIRLSSTPSPTYRYFDLSRDPLERANRYGEPTAQAQDLVQLADAYAAQSAAASGGKTAAPPAPPLDPERAQMLRTLGYLEEEEPQP